MLILQQQVVTQKYANRLVALCVNMFKLKCIDSRRLERQNFRMPRLIITQLINFFLFSALLILFSCSTAPTISSDKETEDCEDVGFGSQIINGRLVTTEDKISKDAVLLVISKPSGKTSCTGTPITDRIILTAAHCVSGASQSGITAVFHTSSKCSDGYTREKSITSVNYIIHTDFNQTPQSKSDLALVRLAKNIPGDYPIAMLYDGKSKFSSEYVELLGYGITDEKNRDALKLRTTDKNIQNDLYFKNQLILINQKNETGGFCRGDSGAPIYAKVGNVKKIIGVNSFNIGTQINQECHTASAAMYVPYFAKWIKDSVLEFKATE